METETRAGEVLLMRHPCGVFAVGHRGGDFVLLSAADLRAVVQAAYDDHGVLAEPSITTEADREYVSARAATDAALQAVHNAGVRA